MTDLPDTHRRVVLTLAERLADADVAWALTGSTSFALQGVPVDPDDVDVQTNVGDAATVAECFPDCVVDPVAFSEGEGIRSEFGVLDIEGVRVEVMGGVQRWEDGRWSAPTDVTEHREFVSLHGTSVPVLSLGYEVEAYDALGRDDRATLLAEYVD